MSGDPPDTSQGSSGSGSIGTATGFGVGFLGGFGSGGGFGGSGLGKAAVRGAIQAGVAATRAYTRVAEAAARLQFAESQYSQFAPGEHVQLTAVPKVTPEVTKLGQTIAKLLATGKTKRAAQVETHLAHVQARLQPETQYVYVARYGPNNGPPLRGSADDPRRY